MTGSLSSQDPQKIYSFTHLQQFPVAITTAMSLNQALVDWRQDAISHVILVVIFLALLSLLAISFIRQKHRRRMRVEEELRYAQRELRKLNQSLEHWRAVMTSPACIIAAISIWPLPMSSTVR